MNDFYIGLITTVAIIGLIEALKLEKRLIGALTLVGIAFIYIGFSCNDLPSLIYSILAVACFSFLPITGIKRTSY